jgi:hypothetical protein
MHLKDRQYFANILNSVSKSVTTVNGKITSYQQKKISVQELQVAVGLEQLSMMHEAVIALGTLVMDPAINTEPLPEMPPKIIGF